MDYYFSAHSFLSDQWGKILELFGNDDKLVFCAGTSIIIISACLLVNPFFMFVDFTGRPKFLLKYKIRKDKNIPVDRSRFFSCLIVSLRNLVITCLCFWLLYPVMKWTGMSCDKPLPHIWRAIFEYYAIVYVDEIIIYYTHRAMHSPRLYKRFHKQHHEWVTPISIAAIYNHPFEHLISNVFPLVAGALLVGAHLSTTWYFIFNSQVQTYINHTNYHLPFFSPPYFHDWHHAKFNENFGSNVFLDWFHNTNTNFKKSMQYKRNFVFYGLAPITERVPDSEETEE